MLASHFKDKLCKLLVKHSGVGIVLRWASFIASQSGASLEVTHPTVFLWFILKRLASITFLVYELHIFLCHIWYWTTHFSLVCSIIVSFLKGDLSIQGIKSFQLESVSNVANFLLFDHAISSQRLVIVWKLLLNTRFFLELKLNFAWVCINYPLMLSSKH